MVWLIVEAKARGDKYFTFGSQQTANGNGATSTPYRRRILGTGDDKKKKKKKNTGALCVWIGSSWAFKLLGSTSTRCRSCHTVRVWVVLLEGACLAFSRCPRGSNADYMSYAIKNLAPKRWSRDTICDEYRRWHALHGSYDRTESSWRKEIFS